MKAEAKAEAAPADGGKKKLLIIIIALVLVLAAGGAGAAWFFLHKAPAAAATAEAEEEAPVKKPRSKHKGKPVAPVFVTVDPFTVNLQTDGNGDQYLQLAFTLEVEGMEEVELVKNNMPKVRSRVLLLLSGKRASEINTPEGKKQLGDEIVKLCQQPFEERGAQQDVTDVLFTSFIIQ
jgi:flagellar protein FliL